MHKEEYDLKKLTAIGGRSYNHDGQIIRTPDHGSDGGWLFMGDDYEEYSALDCLVKNVIEYPKNFKILGEITKVEIVTLGGRYTNDYLEITSVDEDGEESIDTIDFEWLSVEVIVNHNTKIEVRRKSA